MPSDDDHLGTLRLWMTGLLLGLLYIIVGLSFVAAFLSKDPFAASTQIVDKVFPLVASLVSAAAGFFYGERHARTPHVRAPRRFRIGANSADT